MFAYVCLLSEYILVPTVSGGQSCLSVLALETVNCGSLVWIPLLEWQKGNQFLLSNPSILVSFFVLLPQDTKIMLRVAPYNG